MTTARIPVRPDRIAMFGADDADTFCLVTNPPYVDAFEIVPSSRYRTTMVVPFADGQRFPDLLRDLPPKCHLMTVLPDCLLHSVPREEIGERKLLIMACRSGRTGLDGIAHFLAAGELTDPAEQQARADAFFTAGEATEYFEFVNDEFGTSARFDHLSDAYGWHEQLGTLDWGDQQVYPAGEIACFLVPLQSDALDDSRRFEVEGRLALHGRVIVQSGPPSFVIEDQERIYARLATIADGALLVDVKNGEVTAVEPSDAGVRPACEMFEALLEVDSRFGRIYEFGFSLNHHVEPWPGNCAMNEVCGGAYGQIHVGFGMLPYTQYHIDVFAAGTRVVGDDGSVIFGGPPVRRMRRQTASACPCMVTP